jgi:hypothetical protein
MSPDGRVEGVYPRFLFPASFEQTRGTKSQREAQFTGSMTGLAKWQRTGFFGAEVPNPVVLQQSPQAGPENDPVGLQTYVHVHV